MALVTVQRSPCGSNTSPNCHNETTDDTDGISSAEDEKTEEKKGISECYFAGKGAALVLPHDECLHVHRKTAANGASDIQQHLQAMLYLLHAEDILKMAVKLESVHCNRTRYLVVMSHTGNLNTEESCLLGIDCNSQTTIGLVLPIWADTRITLDGDGGFSVTSSGRHHIFKPVSVQAMWSALQTLHKASSKAREYNYFKCGGVTHQWVNYYEKHISSDRSCLNEWHAMDDIESRRPPSPDTVRLQPSEREEAERHIRTKLKELMMSVDLDEVTSKYIRTRLEEILNMNLKEYKSFIDQEMLTILGQMDSPTEIFQYLYLGSEWNASNLEELVVNGIGHILNVTREIDNFFPGMFDYQNVRVYDDESTEILHYWDKTYRYIRRAKDEGSKVLVHCKMGISRSASVVIAYVMKAYDWDLQRALDFVKTKRGCIKPNSGFLKQLEIYQGILDASKQRHNSLWRSKSETNLNCSDQTKKKAEDKKNKLPEKSESLHHLRVTSTPSRPKSWSPNDAVADMLFPPNHYPADESYGDGFRSLNENTNSKISKRYPLISLENTIPSVITDCLLPDKPLDNNKNLDTTRSTLPHVTSIKDRINELELQVISTGEKSAKVEAKSPDLKLISQSRSGLVLNLANQFESGSKPSSPVDEGLVMKVTPSEEIVEAVMSQTKPPAYKHHAVLVKPALWPEESPANRQTTNGSAEAAVPDAPCSGKKTLEENVSQLGRTTHLDGSLSSVGKTSHSAFKPFTGKPSPVVDDKLLSSCLTVTLDKQIPITSTNAKDPSPEHKKGESLSGRPTLRLHPSSPATEAINVPSSYLYDKEDIPFTPGTVQRTKQKIEEKNLTRTTSFDSGFPYRNRSMPSTPPESDLCIGKLIRRSHSLRSDRRPNIPFCGKWYPLPALASTIPNMGKGGLLKSSMGHSVSTPSVVEAVNRVICGTQEVLTSAINFMPSDKKLLTSPHTSSDSDFDFGSASSLPELDSKDLDFLRKSPPAQQSESPVPGLVKQQREILENKATKSTLEQGKGKRDASKVLSSETGSSLVATDASLKMEDTKCGIVKRLKKELEAKSSPDACKKEPMDIEGTPPVCLDRLGRCNPSTPSYQRPLSSSLESKPTFEQGKAPPTPHRKTSLDLSFLHKRLPLNFRQPTVLMSNSRTSFSEKPLLTSGRPPPAAKTSLGGVVEVPPSPPTGLRKLRKQQGSSHPLSKLMRQRHSNPLYNTM